MKGQPCNVLTMAIRTHGIVADVSVPQGMLNHTAYTMAQEIVQVRRQSKPNNVSSSFLYVPDNVTSRPTVLSQRIAFINTLL